MDGNGLGQGRSFLKQLTLPRKSRLTHNKTYEKLQDIITERLIHGYVLVDFNRNI